MTAVLRRPRRVGVLSSALLIGSLVYPNEFADPVGPIVAACSIVAFAAFWLLFGAGALLPGPAVLITPEEVCIERLSTMPVPNLRRISLRRGEVELSLFESPERKIFEEAMGETLSGFFDRLLDFQRLDITTADGGKLRVLTSADDAAAFMQPRRTRR
jgi:hypothetical protein